MWAALCWTTITLVIAFWFVFYKYSTRRFDYWKKRNVFHLEPSPFVGNFLPIFLGKKCIGEWLCDLYRKVDEDYFGIFIFDQPFLVLKSPEMVKSVLVKDFSHFQNRSVAVSEDDEILKHALFFSRSQQWNDMRSRVSPVYTSGKLKKMFPLILHESGAMVEFLKKQENLNCIEMKDVCSKYSINVIASCAFAVDAEAFQHEDARFRIIGRRMFDFRVSTAIRQVSSFFLPGLAKLLKLSFFERNIIDELRKIFSNVLGERKKMNNLKGNDLVDMLLEIRRKLSQQDMSDNMLLAQAVQFFAAGFETVGSTAAFAMYELALSKQIQDTLRNEINDILAKHGDITYDAISEMQYLDMIIDETLRKYPVLPFLDRRCNKDYKLPGTDLTIENGIAVLVPMFGFNYDEKYFPDPTKFVPERFADKSKINNKGLFYFPFGTGPRVCIGERFGILGVKMALINLLTDFRLEKSETTPCPLIFEPKSLLLQSTVGIPVRLVALK